MDVEACNYLEKRSRFIGEVRGASKKPLVAFYMAQDRCSGVDNSVMISAL